MSKVLEVIVAIYCVLVVVPVFWAKRGLEVLWKWSVIPVDKWADYELYKVVERKRGNARRIPRPKSLPVRSRFDVFLADFKAKEKR